MAATSNGGIKLKMTAAVGNTPHVYANTQSNVSLQEMILKTAFFLNDPTYKTEKILIFLTVVHMKPNKTHKDPVLGGSP